MRLLIFLFLLSVFFPVSADEWGDRITSLIDVYEKSSSNPKPIVYPELAERVKNVFSKNRNNRVVIDVIENHKQKSKTELYYKNGELHVLQFHEGWNLVTKDGFIYEWKVGDNTGIKIEKKEKDLVDYILYLTDPALFMTGMYNRYKRNPDNFNIITAGNNSFKEFVLKEPLYGFEAVFVDEKVFWFHGFRMKHSDSNHEITYRFTKPTEYKTVPDILFKKMKNIEFKDSDKTIRRHLDYL